MLPDSVIDTSLEILWLTVILLLPVVESDGLLETLVLPDSVIDVSLEIL